MTSYDQRARELVQLALGVGISTDQSVDMVAQKLRAWDEESRAEIERLRYQLISVKSLSKSEAVRDAAKQALVRPPISPPSSA